MTKHAKAIAFGIVALSFVAGVFLGAFVVIAADLSTAAIVWAGISWAGGFFLGVLLVVLWGLVAAAGQADEIVEEEKRRRAIERLRRGANGYLDRDP